MMQSDDSVKRPEPDFVYDARGLFCPIPIIRAAERIEEMKTGEVLEVISDDPGIREDMPAWCESTGHRLIGIYNDERNILALVQKVKRE